MCQDFLKLRKLRTSCFSIRPFACFISYAVERISVEFGFRVHVGQVRNGRKILVEKPQAKRPRPR
jgi:hypothetical protein